MKADSDTRYFNRELSWLFFNTRVLEEAKNSDVPLLERVRFLSISASNLDEFFMVRVAGLRTQDIAGMHIRDEASPAQQLAKIARRSAKITSKQARCWEELSTLLAAEKIAVHEFDDLNEDQIKSATAIYHNEVLPLLTPLTVDPAHPFPFLPNLGFGLSLALTDRRTSEPMFGVLPVPAHVPRFLRLESPGKGVHYISIENLLAHFAADLYPDFEIEHQGEFRITRDSDIAVDEDAEDLVRHFEFLLKKRRRGRVVRLELTPDLDPELREFLVDSFEVWDDTVDEGANLLGMADLSQLVSKARPDLLFRPYTARFPERIRDYDGDCLAAIKAKDILVHHPYEEFAVVIQFLEQAAADPDVVAIKQTLYRTSDDSPIVLALIKAAEAGKNVTALVELKARFDEAMNLRWARDLERAGVQVVYGFVGYKTHAKCSLVIRREASGLQTYTHIGTGNYHAQNARIYTDLALFTADREIGEDVGKIFNFVTSYSRPRDMTHISIAPLDLRERLYDLIDVEIEHAQANRPASIWAKMNALVDPIMIDKLYAASEAGVEIDLVVRGICCLRPGVKDLSENIRVKSIVGRFLEHSRIVCFGNGAPLPSDQAKVFISSADWMPRNLDRRIEVMVPVLSPTVHNQVLDQIMMANLLDNVNSWNLRPTGKYVRVKPEEEDEIFSAHRYFMDNPSLSGRGTALASSAPRALEQDEAWRPKQALS